MLKSKIIYLLVVTENLCQRDKESAESINRDIPIDNNYWTICPNFGMMSDLSKGTYTPFVGCYPIFGKYVIESLRLLLLRYK